MQWGLDSLIDDHVKFNVYNIFVKQNKVMYKILKPILIRFLSTTAVKRLIIDILRETICKQTTNTLDDKAVDMLEQQLFPKLN